METTQRGVPGRAAARLAIRIALTVLVASGASWVLGKWAKAATRPGEPAGFVAGLAHGALMPVAFPSLLLGRDVEIYAALNTGRTYKLGYTSGVNACGAVFFGVLFYRAQRWRRRFSPPPPDRSG